MDETTMSNKSLPDRAVMRPVSAWKNLRMRRRFACLCPWVLGLAQAHASVGHAATAPSAAAVSDGVSVQVEREFEFLDGFSTIVLNQVNRVMGSAKLVAAMGSPVEPGMYVCLARDQVTIFDHDALALSQGVVQDRSIAAKCKSGCTMAAYSAFRRAWLDLEEEASAVSVDVPDRILFAPEADLPARTLVHMAYAAVEARTNHAVPNLHLLVFTRRAGLRALPFYLLPPEGLEVRASAQTLALRVTLMGGERFEISAGGRLFTRTLKVEGMAALTEALADIKENFPGKAALVIDAGQTGPGEGEAGTGPTTKELIDAMTALPDAFPNVVLALGQPIRER